MESRYKVIITLVADNSDDIALCSVSSWEPSNEIGITAHGLVDSIIQSAIQWENSRK